MAITPAPTAQSIADQAKLLGLSVAVLTPELVATAPTDVLPLAVIEARKIFPYQLDITGKRLSVAVADPAQLKQAAPGELQAQRKLGRQLKLELVDPATFDALLPEIRSRFSQQPAANSKQLEPTEKQSTNSSPAAGSMPEKSSIIPASLAGRNHQSSIPLIDLSTVTIPRSVFLKIPHDVATKFRIIAFAAPAGTRVKLASDRPTDPGVKRVVDVIQTKRGVSVELYEVAGSQIDDLIDAYQGTADPVSLVAPSVTKQVSVIPEANSQQQTASSQQPRPVTAGAQAAIAQPAGAMTKPLEKPGTPPPVTPTTVRSVTTPAPVAPPRAAAPVAKPPVPASANTPKNLSPTPTPTPTQTPSPHKAPSTPDDSMPVDSSPVVKAVDSSKPGKIQLASPLPSLASTGPTSFSLPTEAVGDLATNTKSAPNAVTPVTPTPPVAPIVTPITPINAVPPAVSTPAVAPLNVSVAAPGAPISVASLTANSTVLHPANGAVSPAPVALTSASLESTEDQNLDATVGSTVRSSDELEAIVKTGLIPKLLSAILQYAINTGASDIHVEAETGDLRVRYRIDGQLQDILKAPISLHAPLVSRLKILAKMKIDEQRVPQDGRFSASTAGRAIDFRVSTLPAIHGEKVVLRILDKSTSIRAIGELGIDGTNGARVTTALTKPFGIILVTGPTGSGKTTTLYAMLNTLNKPGVNIVTLEDPVEYELPGITQTQVKPKIGFSFAEGLRSILRQDPDVIMVGEIRDRETASLATHAALTGHLVLSTLHTNSAAGAIPRFLDMGVEPFLIASSMEAVIAQRLVRKLCEACRQPAQLTTAIQQDILTELNRSSVAEIKAKASASLALFSPKGCDQCHGGYKGRLGIYEVMAVTPEIEALTAKKAPLNEIETLAIQQGMVTMKQDGIVKAMAGLTSIDEILRVTTSD